MFKTKRSGDGIARRNVDSRASQSHPARALHAIKQCFGLHIEPQQKQEENNPYMTGIAD